jgi:hypothetical protein
MKKILTIFLLLSVIFMSGCIPANITIIDNSLLEVINSTSNITYNSTKSITKIETNINGQNETVLFHYNNYSYVDYYTIYYNGTVQNVSLTYLNNTYIRSIEVSYDG